MAFGDYPTTQQRTIPYKLIGIISVGVVVAILIVVSIVIWTNKQNSSSQIIGQEQLLQKALDDCQTSVNKDQCRKQAVLKVNDQLGTVTGCVSLEQKEADTCIWLYASDNADPSVCDQIQDDEMKKTCWDHGYYRLASKNRDRAICDKIVDEKFRLPCQSDLGPQITSDNCSSLGKPETFCQMMIVAKQANEKQDREICSSLSDNDLLSQCMEYVSIDDADFDGLLGDSEESYGSNPRNPDTDADGYKDGDEVAAGFNPAGPGKLEIKTAPPEPFVLPF